MASEAEREAGTIDWRGFADRLRRELDESTDPSQRTALLHALSRVLSDKLDSLEDAHGFLDEAFEGDPADQDLAWDTWRAAGKRGVEQQIASLESLSVSLERPQDVVSARLWLARLLRDHFQDDDRAAQETERAVELLPDHSDALWAQAEIAAGLNDPAVLKRSLERLAELSRDSGLRAALYIEIANVEHAGVASRSRIAEFLAKALEESEADWSVLASVEFLSAEIGDWSLHERALERMATIALESEPEDDDAFPAGHDFVGFERGAPVAAALWWQIALVRERRRDRPDEALSALEMARELLPGHAFLEWERARLMEASDRPEDALEVVPDDASDTWKAQLALSAGRSDLALSLALSGRDTKDSVLGRVMARVAGDVDDSKPADDADISTLKEWFLSNPGHPGALKIAQDLDEAGIDLPAVRLAVWEGTPPDGKWPADVLVGDTDESWPLAVEAVLGAQSGAVADQAQAFLDWAVRTADLTLEAAFIAMAARLHEGPGGSAESALELYRRAEELDPETSNFSADAVRLMHMEGKWVELAERLADEASISEDELTARAAQHERAIILEYAIDDPVEAADAFSEITSFAPEDVVAIWSAVKLAFRLGNWQLVEQELTRLKELCPDDAALFRLLSGEIALFSIGNYDEALHHFETAARSEDSAIAQAARFYSLYILYQLGDLEALVAALKEEFRDADDDVASIWLPEILGLELATRGPRQTSELLEQGDEPSPLRLVWDLLVGLSGTDWSNTPESMRRLAAIAPPGEMAGACRTAAAILEDRGLCGEDAPDEADLESAETLWHTADRLELGQDPMFSAEIYKERASLVEETDELEWVDWMLLSATAEEKAKQTERALATVNTALERKADHPGLLEARARLAAACGNWAEAADTHGRLARYYISEEEKAFQLAQAAHILFDKLGDDKGAQNICEEALRRVPGHADAHEVFVRVLKKRGDEAAVTTLLEKRIGAESDKEELVQLYEEKADQMLGLDDSQGALDALEQLLHLDPDRLSAYLTKIEVLADLGQWAEAIDAMREYITRADDPVEARMTTWRAADLIVEELGDPDAALGWLGDLVESGDRHPDTLRRIATIARSSERWETAADALSQLSALIQDNDKRVTIKREEAEIRLERLFDDERAAEIVEEILADRPADLPTLELSLQFRGEDQTNKSLYYAIKAVRDQLQENPTDLTLVASLRELSLLKSEGDLTSLCDDIILLLSGGQVEPWPGDLVPAADLDAETQRRFFVHPDETNAASRVAQMSSGFALKALPSVEHLPKIGRGTRTDQKKNDPVKKWMDSWAKLLGFPEAEVHRVGDDSRGAVALPDDTPTVAVSLQVMSPLNAKYRFFLARSLWRSARGLGGFAEGDTAGPTRWVVAVAAAILGERIELPLSTDRETVVRAKKAMPRRLRRSLTDPCNLLLKETRQSLRAWAQAISFSADRFGLLAATRLVEVIPLIIEESAGEMGTKKFREDPAATIRKVPRCLELLRFALSEDYLAARRKIGLNVQSQGGGR